MVALLNTRNGSEFGMSPDAPAIVDIQHVSRRFGENCALDDVSFRVPRGTVVGLVGENGAGKTTLIKHILGLLKAQTGTVRVFGLDPVADPVGVLVAHRLPFGGAGHARLDARPRADSLRRGVLSDLGP